MKVKQFTENHQIVNILYELKESFLKNGKNTLIVSDTIDEDGFQYVDLVQEGGGVLGIALLGYTYILEQMGIRFLSMGGTSAGAINSLLLAACGKPNEEKTVKLLEALSSVALNDFIDGDSDAREFIDSIIAAGTDSTGMKKALKSFNLLIDAVQVFDNFRNNFGLNPGKSFLDWMDKELARFDITALQHLQEKMRALPESIRFRGKSPAKSKYSELQNSVHLAIVAAELTTETKVIFPEMANLFYKHPDLAPPSHFARASMSLPLFFEPFTLEDIPTGKDIQTNWRIGAAGYIGPIPEKAVFVDGGIMSNFPIDVFHKMDSIPSRPTFGIKLGLERNKINKINNVLNLLYSSFNAARNHRDFEFVNKNKDFKNLVGFIDVEGIDWLDFNIKDETKIKLFVKGAKAAKAFLEKFNWKEYKKIRKEVAEHRAAHQNAIQQLEKKITAICFGKEQQLNEMHIKTIADRLYNFGKNIQLKGLWIDDSPESVEKEIALLEELGVNIKVMQNSEEAKKYINRYGHSLDLILSDISRNQNSSEGVEFAKWLHSIDSAYRNKLIFYISNYDISRGAPPYSFGITNSFIELFHMVIDIAQRTEFVDIE